MATAYASSWTGFASADALSGGGIAPALPPILPMFDIIAVLAATAILCITFTFAATLRAETPKFIGIMLAVQLAVGCLIIIILPVDLFQIERAEAEAICGWCIVADAVLVTVALTARFIVSRTKWAARKTGTNPREQVR